MTTLTLTNSPQVLPRSPRSMERRVTVGCAVGHPAHSSCESSFASTLTAASNNMSISLRQVLVAASPPKPRRCLPRRNSVAKLAPLLATKSLLEEINNNSNRSSSSSKPSVRFDVPFGRSHTAPTLIQYSAPKPRRCTPRRSSLRNLMVDEEPEKPTPRRCTPRRSSVRNLLAQPQEETQRKSNPQQQQQDKATPRRCTPRRSSVRNLLAQEPLLEKQQNIPRQISVPKMVTFHEPTESMISSAASPAPRRCLPRRSSLSKLIVSPQTPPPQGQPRRHSLVSFAPPAPTRCTPRRSSMRNLIMADPVLLVESTKPSPRRCTPRRSSFRNLLSANEPTCSVEEPRRTLRRTSLGTTTTTLTTLLDNLHPKPTPRRCIPRRSSMSKLIVVAEQIVPLQVRRHSLGSSSAMDNSSSNNRKFVPAWMNVKLKPISGRRLA